MALNLVDHRLDFGDGENSIDLFAIEIRYTNAAHTATLYQFLHFFPGIDIVDIAEDIRPLREQQNLVNGLRVGLCFICIESSEGQW